MRILHLVHQYLPEKIGGTELYTRTLAQQQVRQGHSVAIFSPTTAESRTGVDHLRPTTEASVRIYRIPAGNRGPARVFSSLFGHRQLRHAFSAVLDQERPDLIHIQHLIGLPAALVDDIHTAWVPFLVTLHDYWYICANAQLLTNYDNTICSGPNWWLNCSRCALARAGYPGAVPLIPAVAPIFAYRHARLRQVLAKAKRIIAPTEFVRQAYGQANLPAEKIEVVTHGIHIPEALPRRTSPDHELHIAYIGGLSWQKGVHILIDAFNRLEDKKARLSIIGDTDAFPGYVAQLREAAQGSHIEFTGRLDHVRLWKALANIDLVVVPSLWYETSSLIIQEAFAAGVAVVASNIGALREKVDDGLDGLLVPPGDVAALADALSRLQKSPGLLDRLRSGIQPVRTIQQHVAALDLIYKQIVDNSSVNHRSR